jgi:N-formylglutamate deformylase
VAEPPIYTLHRGHAPLVVSLPHVGTHVPAAIARRLVPRAAALEDTDWHLEAIYAFAKDLGASVLAATHSRWVIDLNRPPEDTPMYAGVNNTGLVPRTFFSGEALYRAGTEPEAAEVAQRRETFWRPYHEALGAELRRVRERHGHVVLWEGHSIRSELPWLFEGTLPHLNLGTAAGAACGVALRARLQAVLEAQTAFTHVTDGRFKGGHITRTRGRPHEGIHAVQMEKCWRCYLDEAAGPPWAIDPVRAATLAPVLDALLRACLEGPPGP